MALIHCLECGHEISKVAIACPNCGRPIQGMPVAGRTVVVAERPREEGGFPTWAFILLGIFGVILLFVLFAVIRRDDDEANQRVNVNLDSERRQTADRTTTAGEPHSGSTSATERQSGRIVPPSSSQKVNVPGSQTAVSEVPATKSTVMMEAKVVARDGSHQAMRGQKVYLLDKDIESILTEAELEPIDGQSLLNSFGLSILNPDRYAEFKRNAFRAIKDHIKYAGQTDAAGKAQLGGVEPNIYFVFAIGKAGNGFAVWSSPVSVLAGENVLNLGPQTINEIQDIAG